MFNNNNNININTRDCSAGCNSARSPAGLVCVRGHPQEGPGGRLPSRRVLFAQNSPGRKRQRRQGRVFWSPARPCGRYPGASKHGGAPLTNPSACPRQGPPRPWCSETPGSTSRTRPVENGRVDGEGGEGGRVSGQLGGGGDSAGRTLGGRGRLWGGTSGGRGRLWGSKSGGRGRLWGGTSAEWGRQVGGDVR